MPITLDDKMKKLSPARRKKVEARAAKLIAQEMSLRDLRKALSLTQERLAERLKVSQDRISRMERRNRLAHFHLRRHVAAMGGNLSLVAEFPDREPVILAGFANMDAEQPQPVAGKLDARSRRAPDRLVEVRVEPIYPLSDRQDPRAASRPTSPIRSIARGPFPRDDVVPGSHGR